MPIEDHDLRAREGAAGAPPPGAVETALAGIQALPEDTLILIPTRNLVLFPGTVLPITLGRQHTIAAAQAASRLSRPVGLVLQRDPATDDPIPVDLHRMGTEATLLRYVTSPDGTHHAICQGERRFRILDFVDGYPFLAARVERVPEVESTSKDIAARLINLRNQSIEVLQLLPQVPTELVTAVQSVTSAPALADLIASFTDITPPEKQEILETIDVERRLDRVSAVLAYRIEVFRLSRQVDQQTEGKIDDRQSEFLLSEQIKTTRKEFAEDEDAKGREITELFPALVSPRVGIALTAAATALLVGFTALSIATALAPPGTQVGGRPPAELAKPEVTAPPPASAPARQSK
jgi:ATP-dependent Lon protease